MEPSRLLLESYSRYLLENFRLAARINSDAVEKVKKTWIPIDESYLCFGPRSPGGVLHFLPSSPASLSPRWAANVLLRLLAAPWNADGETHKTTIHLYLVLPFFPPRCFIVDLLPASSCSMTIYACIRAGFWRFPSPVHRLTSSMGSFFVRFFLSLSHARSGKYVL